MDLHYSQTDEESGALRAGFTTLWIYTILKPRCIRAAEVLCFTTLWIYTILKPRHLV